MVLFFFKRHAFTAYVALLVLLGGLLLPVNQAFAEPIPPPPTGGKTDRPKPGGAPSNSASQTAIQADNSSPLAGRITDQPKPRGAPSNTAEGTTANLAAATSWTVSLASSNYAPNVNQGFTLTARAYQDVGPTPYYIQIYLGATRYASCGAGTICSVTLFGPQAGASYAFQARIATYDGSNVQAWPNIVTVRILGGASVSLSSSTNTPNVGQAFTLTARANQDVGPTPYYIQIYLGATRYASCGAGTTCSVTLSGPQAGASYAFQARIAAYDGSNVQAWSNILTVNISGFAGSWRLPVPFLTQIGSAGVPGVGSMNCGPASVAMVIGYFGSSISVQDAAIAIRGSNTPANGGTDFKGASTAQLLSRYGRTTNAVYTFDDMRREIALGRPVIILVNNTTYRYNSPAPYVNNNNGWFVTNHIVVVTGYDTNYVYINDPLRYASTSLPNPANYAVPVETFKSAAGTTPSSSTSSWYALSVR